MKQNSKFLEVSDKITRLEKIIGVEPEYFEDINKLSLELPKIIQAEKDLLAQGQTLRIGVIGQVKAGKSSFLNALLFQGKDLLPKASTPMTAGLTVIGYAERPKFKVEYYSEKDWNTVEGQARQYDAIYREAKNSGQFEDDKNIEEATKEKAGELLCSSKELVERCNIKAKNCIGKEPLEEALSSIDDLHGRLHQFVGANGDFTSVTKTLYLYLPEEGLKGIEIVDTPGVNDPIVSREERTNEFLRSCHGVFLLSYTGQFCSNTDMTFLKERVYDQGINEVVVLGSKFDSGLIDIARTTDGDLEYAVEKLSGSLKEMLKEAFDKKNLRNELPKLNCTSGLCYSLYHKPKNQWDENEAHIAKLLIKNYSNFGENKEWFKVLGNIEEIKEAYIEKDFKVNRDNIITKRHDDFIENNKNKILNIISDTKNDLEDYSKKVDSLNSDSIKSQKNQRSNVEKLGKASVNLINHTIKDINVLPDTFLNEFEFEKFSHKSYLRDRSYDVIHDSGSWYKANNKYSYSVSVVDSSILKEILKEYLDSTTKKIVYDWSNHFSEKGSVVKDLKTEILKLLTGEFSEIDPEMLQDVLNNSLKDISRGANDFSKLSIEKFYTTKLSRISSPKRDWKFRYKKEENPQITLNEKSEKERIEYFDYVNAVISEYKIEIRNRIWEQKESIGKVVEGMKKSFETNIGKKFEEVTVKYEKAVDEKESKLDALSHGIHKLTEIEEILNEQYEKQRIKTTTGVLR